MGSLAGAAVVAAIAVAYSLVARRLDRLLITAPMVFVLVGAVLGEAGGQLVSVRWRRTSCSASPS